MSIDNKIFIDKDNRATFVCPKCGDTAVVDVSHLRDVRKTVRLKRNCPCGHTHTALLERRRYIRKNVNLAGVFILPGDAVRHSMTVRDLSRTGMKIIVKETGIIAKNDRLTVEFHLDNLHKTFIRKEGIARNLFEEGRIVGLKFHTPNPDNPIDKVYDRAIAHYTFN
jgi:predicted RNA-binding Zn-ribbon protein involved in translation (DUF1610 family)